MNKKLIETRAGSSLPVPPGPWFLGLDISNFHRFFDTFFDFCSLSVEGVFVAGDCCAEVNEFLYLGDDFSICFGIFLEFFSKPW